MRRDSEPSSFLNQEDGQQLQGKIEKQQSQFKALFLKNLRLQSKQKGTNCCQIITPIICLIFTFLIKNIAEDGFKTNIEFEDNNYPYKFNDYNAYDKLNTYSFTDKNNNTITTTARSAWLQYYLFECMVETGCDKEFLGANDGKSINGTKSGMLGNVNYNRDYVYYVPEPYTNPNKTQYPSVPFFIESDINTELYNRLTTMSDNSIEVIKKGPGLSYIPDGSIKFYQLNNESMKVDIKVDDVRDLDLHRSNGISKNKQVKFFDNWKNLTVETQFTQSYGLLNVIHVATAAFIKTINDKVIEAGFLLMPPNENSFVDTLINSISGLIYPLGLSLLFPVFLYSIVLEKQERLVQMMKMNGLKIRYYWFTFFVFNLMLCVITNLIFYLIGTFILGTPFFTKTSKVLLLIVSIGWSLAQIGMAAFFQTFLNKSRSANIIGYLFSIWTTMIGATLSLGSYQYPSQLPVGLQIIPPFGFVRTYYLMMMKCSQGDCFYDMGVLTTELKQCIVFLYLGFVVFFLLGIYLFEVIPQQFGVRRSPFFPFYDLVKLFKSQKTIQINTSQDPELREYISEHEEDDFSKKERQKVISFSKYQDQQKIMDQNPLIINNMRKLYKKQGIKGFYPAVRSFNLAIGAKETFGLLGPNGAGKTTLISMITGMYEPNYGNAWIGGYDIQTSIEKAQLQMGVCPQFDLVWPQLSVQEHLYFYARLKGIPEKRIKQQVQQSIREVKLDKFSKFAASELSGGMRRRLSVAISLVGDPKIVFLDEPSTGLDPENRRQLWSVLAQCQTKRALFITTHMMQQADTLCNRVGIITSGVLRTIQTPIKLKKTYGQGYDVVINTIKEERQLISQQALHIGIEEETWHRPDQKVRESISSFIEHEISKSYRLNHVSRKIVQFMKKQFPGSYLFKHFNGYLILKVPSTFKISTLFQTMKKVQKQLGFSDVAITNSSLQDVFMKVVERFDTDEKKFYPYNTEQVNNNDDSNDYHPQKIDKGTGKFVQVKEPVRNPSPTKPINRSSNKLNSIDYPQQKNKRSYDEDEHQQSFFSHGRQSILSENHSPQKHPSQDDKSPNRNELPKKSQGSESDYF